MDIQFYREKLEEAGVAFAPGLTEAEARRAEESYGFHFPPDLLEFLTYALPVSKGWPDWREPDSHHVRQVMSWPFEGICFDIERNGFWLDDWGPKPRTSAEAFAVAQRKLNEAPKLVPVCGHRYLPDRPGSAGNPVFSVYQTDIIYYGSDLRNYFENEFSYFFGTPGHRLKGPIRRIEFWSGFAEEEF